MPVIASDMLKEWLQQTVDISDVAKQIPSTNMQFSLAVQRTVLDFLETVNQMDSALEILLRNTGSTISTSAIHVNIPLVIEALERVDPTPGYVYLVSVPSFYEESPQADGRVDVVLGATLWNGALLCRPVLASLEKVETVLGEAVAPKLAMKLPTVSYTPQYGHH